MPLEEYISRGAAQERACFSCGRVSLPQPPSCNDLHGIELRCGLCGSESALPLENGVREGWVQVIDAEGRIQNDDARHRERVSS